MSEVARKQRDDNPRRKNEHLFHTIENSVLGIENMEFLELYDELNIEKDLDENCKYVYGEKGGLYEIKDYFYHDCEIDSSQTDLKMAVDLLNPDKKLVAKIYPGGGYSPCFRNEIKASEQLGLFCDYLEDMEDKAHIFIREYAEGDTLSDFVEKHENLTDTDRFLVLMNIIAAMDNLHKHNVLHCDLKTSNILVKEDLTIELFDFGASSVIEDFSKKNYPKYKYYVNYMPPELGRKGVKKPIDERTDIFFLKYVIKKLGLRDFSKEISELYKMVGNDYPEDREYPYEVYKKIEEARENLRNGAEQKE